MKCNAEEGHQCVYLGCNNHAPYTLFDISDNYCYNHARSRAKEWGMPFSEWYKEKCKKLKASQGEQGDVKELIANVRRPLPGEDGFSRVFDEQKASRNPGSLKKRMFRVAIQDGKLVEIRKR